MSRRVVRRLIVALVIAAVAVFLALAAITPPCGCEPPPDWMITPTPDANT